MSEAAATTPPSWRQSVPQKYRSKEVNEIANVLASLEPGATPPSKLMLASQFENKMFNDASGLSDYRKKIQRRLKKMQKNYRATNATMAVPVTNPGGGTVGPDGSGRPQLTEREEQAQKESIARLKRSLLLQHGDKLKLIVENGHATSKGITDSYGVEKGERFSQHVDCALQWVS